MGNGPKRTLALVATLEGRACNVRALSTGRHVARFWDFHPPPVLREVCDEAARACALGTHTIARVHLWECAVGFYVVYATTTTTIHNCSGEIIDPGVTNATSPNCAEATTGSRIGFYTNGSTTVNAATSWSSAGTSTLLTHSGSANAAHFFALTVGAATLVPIQRTVATFNASTTVTCVNDDGDMITDALTVEKVTGNVKIGRLREMLLGPDAKIGQTASASGVVKAYAASTSVSSDTDTLWLQA